MIFYPCECLDVGYGFRRIKRRLVVAERSVWITTELSRLEEKVDVSAIPGITNQNYMVNNYTENIRVSR